MKQPHVSPSDITVDEVRAAIGDGASRFQVEDYLFDNLNDDFSLDKNRDQIIDWYHSRLNK